MPDIVRGCRGFSIAGFGVPPHAVDKAGRCMGSGRKCGVEFAAKLRDGKFSRPRITLYLPLDILSEFVDYLFF